MCTKSSNVCGVLRLQVEDFKLSVKLQCELRPYQQEGIAWLAFLRRTGLHGCLADDMGLGKTLQATAIVAGLMCICLMCITEAYRFTSYAYQPCERKVEGCACVLT